MNVLAETLYGVADKMKKNKNFKFDIAFKQKSTYKNISAAKKISFSSILCALGVVILFLGSVIEVMDISVAAIASFLIIVSMIEMGGYMPPLVYLATSTISFLLLPTKTVVLIYVLFFGFYPILKKYLEMLPPLISWLSKLFVFNVVITVYYFFAKELLFPGVENLSIYIILFLNFTLFLFDFTLTLFVTAYVRRFRKLLRIHRYFK